MTMNYCSNCKQWKQTIGWIKEKPYCRDCIKLVKGV